MTDDETTFELDLSAIKSDDDHIHQLVAAAETWSGYTKTNDAHQVVTDAAVRALSATKMMSQPIPLEIFSEAVAGNDVINAIKSAMNVPDDVMQHFVRYADMSLRGLIIAAVYRLVSEISVRTAVTGLVTARHHATAE